MAGSMCCSFVMQMSSWRGLVSHQRRQCTVALFRYIVYFTPALSAAVSSRLVSNSSLPERYVPRKNEREKVAGSGAGVGSDERKWSQPDDSEFARSRVHRNLGNRGERNVENAVESRPSTKLSENHGSKVLVGVDDVKDFEFEPHKNRKKKLQQLVTDGELHSDPHIFNSAEIRAQGKESTQSHDAELAAKDYCISLLALAPQPEAKLRAKMNKKNFPAEVIDAVMADLQRCGLQSDQEYAEVFARSRWNGNAWGPQRIKFELLRRGLGEENVEAGLHHVFGGIEGAEEVDEEEYGTGKWGMNPKAVEQLITQARRRWSQGSKSDINTRKRRMAGWLHRRGFSWSVTSDLLQILEREEELD